MRRFTQIKGLSQLRRLPRLGRVRLGIKAKNPEGKEYPKETPYFVVPPEIAKVYGDQPTELDVMIPIEPVRNQRGEIVDNQSFPQSYAFYGSSRGLKCNGDGESAMRTIAFHKELNNEKPGNGDSRELIKVPCTCSLYDTGKCKQVGYLQVLLPKVSVGGVYAIVTSSYNSIVDLNSGIDYVYSLIGRVAMVPLKLKREPRETHYNGKKHVHYTMRFELEGDIDFINTLRENTTRVLSGPTYALPAPLLENPEFDDDAIIEEETDDQPQENESQTPPAITKDALIANMDNATTIDQVNELLDLARELSVSDRSEVVRSSTARVKKLRASK